MPDKLTDNDIKKALEDCIKHNGSCFECPSYEFCDKNDTESVMEMVLDYINRLEAEMKVKNKLLDIAEEKFKKYDADIKRLTSGKCIYLSDDEYTEYCVEGPCPHYKTEAKIKSEAYKEFADKVHTEIHQALESNYKARAERMAKTNVDMADEFISYCEGKIAALRGIDDFINNITKEMIGG